MIKKLRSISKEPMIEDSENKTLNGIYETISELIGFDNTKILYENFRGNQVNFPVRLFSFKSDGLETKSENDKQTSNDHYIKIADIYADMIETLMSPKDHMNGVYETLSELIGYENTKKLYEYFKGSEIAFPVRLFSK